MKMQELKGKHILLGVTGSIAAVKAPIIARELIRNGAKVTVAMTEGAKHFVTPTALSVLTKGEVITEVFPKSKEQAADAGTWHIHLARSVDAMLIAPCSAATVGRLRAGIYDNPVTLLAASLPHKTPLVLHPAMDEEMWLQPVLQENLTVLHNYGASVIEPTEGALASGLTGKGRMLEPVELVEKFAEVLRTLTFPDPTSLPLQGKKILITGGPTYEPIDAVRFIGNRSSGKMSVALATAARSLGADVTLVMGPSPIATNGEINRINIETADEMRQAVVSEISKNDIIIMSAAVGDFAAEQPSDKKLKKRELESGDGLTLKLKRTPDILREISQRKQHGQILVGFALEIGEEAEAYAKAKLEEKALDLIVLNRADEPGAGFGHDTNKITLYLKSGKKEELPLMSKEECAAHILQSVITLL